MITKAYAYEEYAEEANLGLATYISETDSMFYSQPTGEFPYLDLVPEDVRVVYFDTCKPSVFLGSNMEAMGAAAFINDDGLATIAINENYFNFLCITDQQNHVRSILLHEMCHVEQLITGRLRYERDGIYWEDVHHDINTEEYLAMFADTNELMMWSYNNMPWEAEAYDVSIVAGTMFDESFGMFADFARRRYVELTRAA